MLKSKLFFDFLPNAVGSSLSTFFMSHVFLDPRCCSDNFRFTLNGAKMWTSFNNKTFHVAPKEENNTLVTAEVSNIDLDVSEMC